ncbi:2-succinyl-5-enolpyruvyl-6-hydroxy-3-cyclohexene-1-carboxylic-acid synthase [Synechococcus sp. MIT S1220]|uniref:2-succinyl-5-enolpyruvyl-6-hydroxy-3- cyclohexene-1-carboxylic-acid synthase n=1 Tax=Synechococcus sp. MIT S1220 TaxID=3082549 RepID=UPI0039B0ADD2
MRQGLRRVVLCPGSRSGPLAVACGLMAARTDLDLCTAIDERSAGFLALGLAMAEGRAVAVITTSGTAVANLLPATVEADRSCQPLLLLTADRPVRLKACGANQTVNQEDFLRPACRWFDSGPLDGLHHADAVALEDLSQRCWLNAHAPERLPPGPVHCNLPLEEPLHAPLADQEALLQQLSAIASPAAVLLPAHNDACYSTAGNPTACIPGLDPSKPGVVVAGPWRGLASQRSAFQEALEHWLQISGWPLFADPLARCPLDHPQRIHHWELLLSKEMGHPADCQVLRLGPLPASRRLEQWLSDASGDQLLITEAESRPLDPCRKALQWSGGFATWLAATQERITTPTAPFSEPPWLQAWRLKDQAIARYLDTTLPAVGACSEPALVRQLARLLPIGFPMMLAASSPVRDWMIWTGKQGVQRDCYGFRGASGIDGTLSLAMGLALVRGPLVLLTGDLALLHDSNGWLHAAQRSIPLLVILIDNNGGGIFQQLPLESSPERFEQLFAMPQPVDPLELAAAHRIPGRVVSCLEDLAVAVDWGIAQQGPALLRICTNRSRDAQLRQQLRAQLP